MKKFLLFFMILAFAKTLYAQPSLQALQQSNQLLLVLTPRWDAINGSLQRYERNTKTHQWQKIGKSIPVVIGKNGMGWGIDLQNYHLEGPTKIEGDKRTPSGIYQIGSAFGFAPSATSLKLPYFPINNSSICVDDGKSVHYNQLIDGSKFSKDWNSGEQMQQIPQYHWGSVIQYNTEQPKVGVGSCIFMHIWRAPNLGTAGCVAMDESKLKKVLYWMRSEKKPVIAMFTEQGYVHFAKEWHLPEHKS